MHPFSIGIKLSLRCMFLSKLYFAALFVGIDSSALFGNRKIRKVNVPKLCKTVQFPKEFLLFVHFSRYFQMESTLCRDDSIENSLMELNFLLLHAS